jgi:hypothetical protein
MFCSDLSVVQNWKVERARGIWIVGGSTAVLIGAVEGLIVINLSYLLITRMGTQNLLQKCILSLYIQVHVHITRHWPQNHIFLGRFLHILYCSMVIFSFQCTSCQLWHVTCFLLLNFIHVLQYQQTVTALYDYRWEGNKERRDTALRQRRGTLDHFWDSSIHFISSKSSSLRPNLIVLFDLCQVIPICNFH